jgi:adiponectin receptor
MTNVISCRHLIGFFLFPALIINTAMQVPNVIDLNSLQHLPDFLNNADLHKLQTKVLICLPSMPDLQRLGDEISS